MELSVRLSISLSVKPVRARKLRARTGLGSVQETQGRRHGSVEQEKKTENVESRVSNY